MSIEQRTIGSKGSVGKKIAGKNAGKKKLVAPKGERVASMKGSPVGAEQTLNIGSQSSGIGAGKITFNPF
jgi:hypothetical protein